MIRAARADDLPLLRQLERAAGAAFRDLDMAAVADDEPPSVADLAVFQEDGRAWVAVDDTDQPVAYLLLEVVDGAAHVEQVSVYPNKEAKGRLRGEQPMLSPRQNALASYGSLHHRLRDLGAAGLRQGLNRDAGVSVPRVASRVSSEQRPAPIPGARAAGPT